MLTGCLSFSCCLSVLTPVMTGIDFYAFLSCQRMRVDCPKKIKHWRLCRRHCLIDMCFITSSAMQHTSTPALEIASTLHHLGLVLSGVLMDLYGR